MTQKHKNAEYIIAFANGEVMPEETRFCKDCIHFREGYRLSFCENPAMPPSTVSGNKVMAAVFCRGNLGWCGKEGRHYEKKVVLDLDRKPSLWERVVKFVKWK